MQDPQRQLETTHRMLVILGTLCLMLAVLLGWQLRRAGGFGGGGADRSGADHGAAAPGSGEGAGADDQGAVERMVAASGGLYDSHPDAQVARVLLPGLVDRPDRGDLVSSNRFGLRERDWEQPKPEGLVRVVLLGDSFIHGMGVSADARLGHHLQARLEALLPAGARVEVLHVGITSWNQLSQEAWLRRKLSLIDPDLVLHHSVPNDLDDTSGIRGFGAPGRLTPQRPEQGDVLLRLSHPRFDLHSGARSLMAWGQDGESRARYAEAARSLSHLSRAVLSRGSGYALVMNWHVYSVVAHQQLIGGVDRRLVSWLPASFHADPALRISDADEHWNPAGHEQMGAYLCGLILERELLPGLVGDDEEARELFTQLSKRGVFEARNKESLPERLAELDVRSAVDAPGWTATSAGQVLGGVDREGMVGPYAALVLATEGGDRLLLEGLTPERRELTGARVHVWVDEVELGSFTLAPGAPVSFDAALPPALAARPWVAVRLQSEDWAHAGDDLRHLVTFALTRLAIESAPR